MPNLTSQQATDLSNYLLELSKAIIDFRFDESNLLSSEQKQKLDKFLDQISKSGQDILAQSTTLIMDEVQDSLTRIKKVTEEINTTLKDLKNVQKVINVAASVVTLGSAIISNNPQSIGTAIGELVKVWKS